MSDLNRWATSRSFERSRELLNGAIDLHVHAGPHLKSSPRSADPVQAAMQAKEAGMRALVFMDVFLMSTGTAWMVNRLVPDFTCFGGIILSTVMGGLNPRAVKTAMQYGDGAKFVSFGAHSTAHQASKDGAIVDGEYVRHIDRFPKFVDEEYSRSVAIPLDGKLTPAFREIMEVVAGNPELYVVSGHVSPAEALALIDITKDFGIEKLMLSHTVVSEMSLAQMQDAAARGALLEIDFCQFTHTPSIPKTHYYVEPEWRSTFSASSEVAMGGMKVIADKIRVVGAQHCVFVTDFGVYSLPAPVEGMRNLVASLLDLEFSLEEIELMIKHNPARLLGLE